MPLGRCSAIFRSEVSRKGARYLPRCAEALIFHRGYQDRLKNAAGSKWYEHGLVVASTVGTQRNASNVLRSFRAIVKRAGFVTESRLRAGLNDRTGCLSWSRLSESNR